MYKNGVNKWCKKVDPRPALLKKESLGNVKIINGNRPFLQYVG